MTSNKQHIRFAEPIVIEPKLDQESFARILCRLSQNDMFNGTGRVLLSDLRQEFGHELTGQQVIDALKTFYPQYPVRQTTENVILIKFESDPSLFVDPEDNEGTEEEKEDLGILW